MNARYKIFFLILSLLISLNSKGQTLPDELYFAPNHQILMGSMPYQGLYDHSVIKTMDLTFNQPHYWDTMLVNYYTYTDLPATFEVDGVTYDSVGVRFRGATSFYDISYLNKLSFNISLDYAFPDQRIDGYKSLNLNNTYKDNSMMREYVYNTLARQHIPMPRVSYVWLRINGMDWGLYVNLQQENKDYLKQWFMTNNGSFWRATFPDHHIGPPPNKIGDGKGSMCYLGPMDTTYQKYYTLRSSDDSIPWQRLITACYQLSVTNSSNFMDSLSPYFDVDQALWMLATENIFSDDDSYIFKGRTDYCIYHEPETGRIIPIQYDGNSVMQNRYVRWSIYYNADSVNYPLLHNLLLIPSLKQRYLAHYRTLIKDYYDTLTTSPLIDSIASQIDALVQADTMKLTTYPIYLSYVGKLKNDFGKRRAFLDSLSQFQMSGPDIGSVKSSVGNVPWKKPNANDSVFVTAVISHSAGLNKVLLYYCNNYVGNFLSVPMYDDGTHGDINVNDSIYSAYIPPGGPGVMRFYIEAIANNTVKTASYRPPGAEHNVFYYFVNPVAATTSNGLVINEIMAKNQTAVSDAANEFDDWIELYNNSNVDINLSNYSITDDTINYHKFVFGAGLIVPANGYLILWADDQGWQGNTHLNFSLSSDGEQLFLLNPQSEIVDSLTFGVQLTDSALARLPNGTGNFITQRETFNKNNDISLAINHHDYSQYDLQIYPNPADANTFISTDNKLPEAVFVYDIYGQCVDQFILKNKAIYNTKLLPDGFYTMQSMHSTKKLIVMH